MSNVWKYGAKLKYILNPSNPIFAEVMEQSMNTIERGVAENISLSILNLVERHFKSSFCCNGWYSKKDASWNIGVYFTSKNQPKRADGGFSGFAGKGVDQYAAALDMRTNTLKYFSDMFDKKFTNLYAVEVYLDELEDVERNEVGAVIGEIEEQSHNIADVFTELHLQLDMLMKEIEILKSRMYL